MKFVVVGGGVIGASVAWHLAKQGIGEVILLERDRLGCGTTSHSAGNITWKPSHEHDAPVLYAFSTRWTASTRTAGLETGWPTTGRMFLTSSAETHHNLEAF